MWIQAAKKKKVVLQLTIKSVSGLPIFFFLFSTTSKKKQLYHINTLEPFRFSLEKNGLISLITYHIHLRQRIMSG